MNKQTSFIFATVHDNEVICFDTNLKGFHKQLTDMFPSINNYQWFYRKFGTDRRFSLPIGDKEYYFQKLT
ncbi:hypothetical protein HDF23_002489 [Mucilaginibacter lappiensis]|uniref:Uncharacterized protein n=1 Tax=Mucilaginibacter lappiensis TaxID=354630 RepID=A0ABR6PL56_9SPHI|nr:hypothetical protein [Mucilaginibacter lappiensis]MBB6109740.1 hypothetical protein [Mucilaginibacter lappiensis]